MSRKRSNNTTINNSPPSKPTLPIPGPLNIATREYYAPSVTVDTYDADIDYPADADADDRLTSSTEPQQQNPFNANEVVKSQDMYDFVEITKSPLADHSPSASDIVLNSDLLDMAEMSGLDRELRGRGVPALERKRALLELEQRLTAARKRIAEEAERARLEEIDREYEETQRRGREEV
ncbi:hypothetical protein E8E11_007754 [Didymella keratinophila]|nr:hypothetical protein E8E11_007754 [Didymella keratinophila]